MFASETTQGTIKTAFVDQAAQGYVDHLPLRSCARKPHCLLNELFIKVDVGSSHI